MGVSTWYMCVYVHRHIFPVHVNPAALQPTLRAGVFQPNSPFMSDLKPALLSAW